MDRGSRRYNQASTEKCKKKPKERHKGAAEYKEEFKDKDKKYSRCLWKKNSQRQ